MGDEIGTMAHAAIHDILDHRLTPDSDRAAKRANFDVTTQVIQTLEIRTQFQGPHGDTRQHLTMLTASRDHCQP